MKMAVTMKVDGNIDWIIPGSFTFEFSGGRTLQFDFNTSYGRKTQSSGVKIVELENLDLETFPEAKDLEALLLSVPVQRVVEVHVDTSNDDVEEECPEFAIIGIDFYDFASDEAMLISVPAEALKDTEIWH